MIEILQRWAHWQVGRLGTQTAAGITIRGILWPHWSIDQFFWSLTTSLHLQLPSRLVPFSGLSLKIVSLITGVTMKTRN